MKTQEFLNVLESYKDKSLLFEYRPSQFVSANYHITEVKHLIVDAVDCGAQTDYWRETIVQLWESPSELNKTQYMSAHKALSILKKVGKMKPFTMDADLKIEYSNARFHTAQLFVNDFEIKNGNLIFKLTVEETTCKANEICGVEEKNMSLATVHEEEPCCTPDGNCC